MREKELIFIFFNFVAATGRQETEKLSAQLANTENSP